MTRHDLTTAELAALISRNSRLAAGIDSRDLADLQDTAERHPELAQAVVDSATPEALALARDGADADAIRALRASLDDDGLADEPGGETLLDRCLRDGGDGWYLTRGDQGQV
jgi:hypothetical protein